MKKGFITFIIFICLTSVSFSKTFEDIPEKHWAAPSVYDLLKMGVTEGYPDGTFRGENQISRYEGAVLMSLLASRLKVNEAIREKLIQELRSEVQEINYSFLKMKREKEKRGIIISGSSHFRYRVGNITFTGVKSPRVDYRLKSTIYKDLGQGAYAEINLDTTDGGFGGGEREFATSLIDVEGGLKLNIKPSPIDVKVNVGPGVVIHRDTTGIIPSEDYMIFIRPKSAIKLSTSAGNMDFSASYVTRQVSLAGEIGVHEFTGVLGYTFYNAPLFGKLRLTTQPRFLYTDPGVDDKRDVRVEFASYITPSKKIKSKLLFGIGSLENPPDGFYYNAELTLADPWETGTSLSFKAHKVGSEYRMVDLDKYEFVYLNLFDRLILDGTADVGLELTQEINPFLSIYIKGDMALTQDFEYGEDYPGTYLILEEGFNYKLTKSINLSLSYRTFEVPSGIDQFEPVMSKSSDLITIGLEYYF